MFADYHRSHNNPEKSLPKESEVIRLTQEEVEEGLKKLVELPARGRLPVQKLISEKQLIKYLVFGTELFRLSPILLDVKVQERCLVVGDLHSSIDDLLCILYYGDIPPAVGYIFLGDYTGRGNYRLDVLILVLLLKLRWPNHVYMLRGRHESTDEHQNDEFYCAVLDAYNSKKLFYLFAQMFDYMPLAAVVNDAIFCCHGGISQWLSSREALLNVQRPVALQSLSHLEGCLITDLLWADPSPPQEKPFTPSTRGASFTFSENALRATLRAIDCTQMIRGHSEIPEGIREDIRNKCFTVYSAHGSTEGKARGIFIALEIDSNGNLIVDKSRDAMEIVPASCEPLDWCHYIQHFMEQRFSSNPCTYLKEFAPEKILGHYNVNSTFGEQIVTHMHLTNWVLDYGMDALNEVKSQLRNENIPPNARYFPHYFPLLFDKLHGNGGTFRVILSPLEQNVIDRISPPIPAENWPDKTWDVELQEQPNVVEESTRIMRRLESYKRNKARKRCNKWRWLVTLAIISLTIWFVYSERLYIRHQLGLICPKCNIYIDDGVKLVNVHLKKKQ